MGTIPPYATEPADSELQELRRLQASHRQIVQHLEQSREEVRAQAKSLETINAVADAIYRAHSRADVVTRALDAIAAYTRSISAAIFELRPGSPTIDLLDARGFGEETLRRASHLPLDASLTGIAIKTRSVVSTADLANDDRLEPATRQALTAEGFSLTVSVPLLHYDEVVGALNLIYRAQDELTPRERDTLLAVGKTIGVAMVNARYLERLQAEVAERKLAQEELEKFKFVVDQAGEELYLLRPDGTVYYANAAAARSLGASPAQLVGSAVSEFDPAMAPAVFREHVEALKRGAIAPFETLHRAHDGTLLTKELQSAFVRVGAEEYVCITARDITQRKLFDAERQRFENQVRKSQAIESLGAVAGGIAHDFNNLLAGILGNISLASELIAPGSPAAAVLQESAKAAERARGLTRQLLTFARGGAPVKRTTDLRDVLTDAACFVASGKACRPVFDLPDDLWRADVDADQIAQVVQNLVLNAIEATAGPGTIRIAATNRTLQPGDLPLPAGRYVELRVSDSGAGIPPHLLEKIFDPYFTTKQGGTGLGLAVTYSIVDRHGGYVGVDSEAGKGTTFRVLLPAGAVEAASPKPPHAVHRGSGRILVMDDEELLRQLAKAMLSALGYEVEVAAHGEEAITRFAAARNAGYPFDVVVLDLTIQGGLGGRETIRRLRELDPSVRAIVSSGYSEDPVVSQYRDYGFRGVLAKPYQLTELSEAVRAAIDAP